MGPTNLKELFEQFLRGYISESHTVSLESEKEVSRLTDEWFEGFDVEDFYFTSEQLIDYLDYLKENLSEENRGFYHLYYNERHFIDLLGKYLRHYCKLTFMKNSFGEKTNFVENKLMIYGSGKG